MDGLNVNITFLIDYKKLWLEGEIDAWTCNFSVIHRAFFLLPLTLFFIMLQIGQTEIFKVRLTILQHY